MITGTIGNGLSAHCCALALFASADYLNNRLRVGPVAFFCSCEDPFLTSPSTSSSPAFRNSSSQRCRSLLKRPSGLGLSIPSRTWLKNCHVQDIVRVPIHTLSGKSSLGGGRGGLISAICILFPQFSTIPAVFPSAFTWERRCNEFWPLPEVFFCQVLRMICF